MHTFSSNIHKNSSDMALCIDAMDIMYKNKIKAICLISSDSDFRLLALRLRQEGMIVYGIINYRSGSSSIANVYNRYDYINKIDTKYSRLYRGVETQSDSQKIESSDSNNSTQSQISLSRSNLGSFSGGEYKPNRMQELDQFRIEMLDVLSAIPTPGSIDGWIILSKVVPAYKEKYATFTFRDGCIKDIGGLHNIKLIDVFGLMGGTFEIIRYDGGVKHPHIRIKPQTLENE